ncbi:MAG: hypothetical protein IJW48_03690 [Clostridia bacterium]|nr:hypothetical protein [Clostridia bacterium]
MPYINTATTKEISKEMKAELTRELGEAISLLPGKSEEWLMLRFEGGADMAFRGDCEGDTAMVEVSLLGKAAPEALSALTARITEILEDKLALSRDRVYIKYFETDKWGWNGINL